MAFNVVGHLRKSWRSQVAMQIATLSVLSASFVVIAISILVHQNIGNILYRWGNEVKVNVYLKENISDSETEEISNSIEKAKIFTKIKFLSKENAIDKFKERVGHYLPGLLDNLEVDNPLPASYEMTINGGVTSNFKFSTLLDIVQNLKKISGVDEISYGQGWVENYASVLRAFSTTSFIFLVVLMLGALFVVGNSIRSGISQRRDEIEIMELCGATRKMIIGPYILEGILMGVISAGIALAVTYVLYTWQARIINENLSFWSFTHSIEFLSTVRIFIILILGAGIGGLGSFIWVRRISTGWAAAEATAKL